MNTDGHGFLLPQANACNLLPLRLHDSVFDTGLIASVWEAPRRITRGSVVPKWSFVAD